MVPFVPSSLACVMILFAVPDSKVKRRALARLRFNPDPPTMPFHDLLADRQADAGSGIFCSRVKSLENDKNPIRILWIDPDAVVMNGKQPFA